MLQTKRLITTSSGSLPRLVEKSTGKQNKLTSNGTSNRVLPHLFPNLLPIKSSFHTYIINRYLLRIRTEPVCDSILRFPDMYEYQEPTPHLYGRPAGHGLSHDDDDMETYVARTPSGSVYIPSGQSHQVRPTFSDSVFIPSDQSDQVRSGQVSAADISRLCLL